MINTLRPHAAQLLVALKKTIPAVLLLGALSLGLAPSARAQITLTFQESGTDVIAAYSGSWTNISTSLQNETGGTLALTTTGFFSIQGDYVLDGQPAASGQFPFPDFSTNGASKSGANFGFNSVTIYGPAGYAANDFLSGSMTFANETFSSLGLTAGASGVVNYTSGNQVNWSVSAVPEPSTYAAFLGLAAMGFAATRRRSRAA